MKRIATFITMVLLCISTIISPAVSAPSTRAATHNATSSVLPYTCNGSTSVSWSTSVSRRYSIHSGFCLRLYGQYSNYNLDLQSDGNLVLYDVNGVFDTRAIWASGTNGRYAQTLLLSTSGNIDIFDVWGRLLWSNRAGNMRMEPGDTTNFKLEIAFLVIVSYIGGPYCPEDDYLVERDGLVYSHNPRDPELWDLFSVGMYDGAVNRSACNWVYYK